MTLLLTIVAGLLGWASWYYNHPVLLLWTIVVGALAVASFIIMNFVTYD